MVMMARSSSTQFLAMAALLLVLLAVAGASVHRTTVRTTETLTFDDDMVEYGRDWLAGPPHCRMEQMDLEECKSYVEHGRQGIPLLGFRSSESSQRPPRRCCQQLSETRQECRCQAIRELVSGSAYGRAEDMEEMDEERMRKRAENLPKTCGLSHHHCSIPQVIGTRSSV
ncbi:unnamed protein product [Victoria cruziana]